MSSATDTGTATSRRLAAPLGMLAAVTGAWAVVATVDPARPGHYPTCPLLAVTGLTCPLCGGLRAAHALAHGDLTGALCLNAFVLVVAPLAAYAWTQWLLRRVRGEVAARLVIPGFAAAPLLVAALIFAVVRNVSGGALGP